MSNFNSTEKMYYAFYILHNFQFEKEKFFTISRNFIFLEKMHQAASDQRQEDIQLRTALETQLSQHREQVIFIFTEFFSHHQKEFQFHEKNKMFTFACIVYFSRNFLFFSIKNKWLN